MLIKEHTSVTEPNLGGGMRIVAPLPDELIARSRALQDHYADHLGPSGLVLPCGDDLSLTFARIVVPEANESLAVINSRIEAIKPIAASALRQTVELSGEPFRIPTAFDSLQATNSEVSIVASEDAQMNQLRRLFTAVLHASMDESAPTTLSVAPIQFSSELDMKDIRSYTEALGRYFTPIKTTFKSLQLVREARPGQPMKIIDEFPLNKKV